MRAGTCGRGREGGTRVGVEGIVRSRTVRQCGKRRTGKSFVQRMQEKDFHGITLL